MESIHQVPPLRDQGIQQKRRQKQNKKQRVWVSRKQCPLNQLIKAHMRKSQGMKQYAESLQKVLCVFVMAFSLRFMGFPSMLMSGSLFHVPSLQFFSFCWFGLSYSDVWVFVLRYCILFYWKTGFNILILSQYKLVL